MEILTRDKLTCSVLESAIERSEVEVILRCENDVGVGPLISQYFIWWVNTSIITELLLSGD